MDLDTTLHFALSMMLAEGSSRLEVVDDEPPGGKRQHGGDHAPDSPAGRARRRARERGPRGSASGVRRRRAGDPELRWRATRAWFTTEQFCASWFFHKFNPIFKPALIQHIELTAIAVGIGMVIAFAAAILAYKQSWFETPFSLLAAFLYTIPSLALFELLVQVTGINRFTVEVGLVSYTLLILFRNTLTGLRGVPRSTIEAAHAMGLTPRQTLWRVEIPLASPAIMAGVRIATVTTISLATVAAYIGGGWARSADLRRDPERIQDGVRGRRRAGDPARDRRRPRARRVPARDHSVEPAPNAGRLRCRPATRSRSSSTT